MEFINEFSAKKIVARDLKEWKGNLSSLEKLIHGKYPELCRVKNRMNREALVNKIFKGQLDFYHRFIIAPYSMKYALLNKVDTLSLSELSKSEQKKLQSQQDVINRHLHELKNNRINVFVVMDDISTKKEKLVICIFNPHTSDKSKLLEFYSVAHITTHCLERIILRLNLSSIHEALEEILTSVLQLEQSCRELQVRKYAHRIDLKRHIPTRNGALLLKVDTQGEINENSVLNCNLITWIHKKQFFNGQEVKVKEFNFVQIINYLINDENIFKLIESWRNFPESMSLTSSSKLYFLVNEYEYEYEHFVSSVENREYLDFMIDFEKNKK